MFDTAYIEQRLSRHFDDAYERVLIKWNEDNSAATKAGALGGSRHHILLAQSARTIGKEAISGAFLTFLSYSRDCAARPQYHLAVARTACEEFIARVGSELEQRSLRQEGFGLTKDSTGPIVQQLITDLHNALEGNAQDAMRGRHGDQQIVVPVVAGASPGFVGFAGAEHVGELSFGTLRERTEEYVVGSANAEPAGDSSDSFVDEAAVNPAAGRATIAELSANIQAEANVAASLTATVSRFALPPEWEADRQAAIRLLTSLPQALEEANQALRLVEEMRRFGIGGNYPPERIDNRTADDIVTEAPIAGDVLLTELRSDEPRIASIRLSALVLRRTVRAFELTLGWLVEKGDQFVNEFAKQLGKRTADAITLAGVVKMLGGALAILAPILALVGSLFSYLGVSLW